MKYRRPLHKEQTLINRALAKWGAFDALKGSVILVGEDVETSHICLVTPELEHILADLKPLFSGLIIGDMAKHFQPTIEGADLFSRLSGGGRNYITVRENAEKLVLYGRDVMGDSIISASDDLDENELVIITNSAGEAIGLGCTRFAGKLLKQKERITITTIKDAGRYLREEDGERQIKASRSPQRRHS